ncbi:MAG: alpha/beta hydrolase [Acidimicrobiia bacterium]
MIAAFFFTWAATAFILTVNALRRPVPPGQGLAPLWLPAMVVSELAPWLLLARAGFATLFVVAGSLELGIGRVGLALFVISEIGLLILMKRSRRAARDTGIRPGLLDLWRVRITVPDGVEVTESALYAEELAMNIYSRQGLESAPALIYLHPGSWMRGGPGRQARPLLYDLANRGWVVLDIRYPLSPAATFPEHLIGVKRAIAWGKTDALKLGIDPDRVAIAGASSGAHLAALAALTDNVAGLQPGFEDIDTSLIACVPHYGIYDLFVRNGTRYDWPFIASHVMKSSPVESPQLYRLGSPIDLAHRQAPPFFVLHGEYDSLVLPAESIHFVEALQSETAPVRYHEVAGGQHGFDAFASPRARAVGALVVDFLEATASDVLSRRTQPQGH